MGELHDASATMYGDTIYYHNMKVCLRFRSEIEVCLLCCLMKRN